MTEQNQNEKEPVEEAQSSNDESVPEAVATDTSETGPGGSPVPDAVISKGEDAATMYPVQVKAALDYAAENQYEYGPSVRDVELTWDVLFAEPMASGIVRIQLEYSPTSSFRGNPGTEYLDVDEGGAILARRQLRTPKENQPVVLMGITAFSVILAVVLISLMTVFDNDEGDPLYVAGRILWIRAETAVTQPGILYTAAGTSGAIHTWGMRPTDEANNELAYIKVTLINQTSGTVALVIDEDAATLVDGNKVDHKPLNSIGAAFQAEDNPSLHVQDFIPMWGSIELNQGEQVSGMLVFEVAKGSSFSELRWHASDSAIIRYR